MSGQNDFYIIHIDGPLTDDWQEWLGGMQIIPDSDGRGLTTFLLGTVPDQAALRGILNRLWDLNLSIISVNRTGRCSKNRR